jgi:hypothetical protein
MWSTGKIDKLDVSIADFLVAERNSNAFEHTLLDPLAENCVDPVVLKDFVQKTVRRMLEDRVFHMKIAVRDEEYWYWLGHVSALLTIS